MPIFIALVFLAAAMLCVLLSAVFIPLGKFIVKIFSDAAKAMQEDDTTEETENTT